MEVRSLFFFYSTCITYKEKMKTKMTKNKTFKQQECEIFNPNPKK